MPKARDQAYQRGYWEGFSIGQYEVRRNLAEQLLKANSGGQHPICEDTLLKIAKLASLSVPRIRLIAKQLGLPYT